MTKPDALTETLAQLFAELIDGSPPSDEAYMLNPRDPGLLRSLDQLSANAASKPAPAGGASIAAHVDHVAYGLELLNRWSDGDPNPWASADWTASWRRGSVTDQEWTALRERLRDLARRWHQALARPRDYAPVELKGVVSSIAHLAYHLGAMRQIDRSLQGPGAG